MTADVTNIRRSEFGQPAHTLINRRLNDRFALRGLLIAVHRGTGQGMVAENTAAAVTAAVRSGGDLVEIDVVRSLDGEYFVFHDGYERQHFGIDRNLQTMSSVEIDQLAYPHRTAAPLVRVQRLEALLEDCPDALLNVDRSWRYWPGFLDVLDKHGVADRVLMKVDATDDEALHAARRHDTKYPLLPIAKSAEAAEALLGDSRLNVVGIEAVTADPTHPFCDPAWSHGLRERATFSYMNALDLGNGSDLLAGWDDTISVLEDPEDGWGRLVDTGADVIQTDWPGLLQDFLVGRGARRP
ncbi:glycerophosphodiester phosphodiesterase family protein [Microbacterium sp. zg-YB36]|uniref:glycerophosphodiester phosphodiesterase family protein n=1 Tax=Microbacterium sp. zg-YB36 TaxID=2969407 RepID=UPI00214C455D|nr:glycerophosphodiester phosphodiesterase family protein [Microbacterium sp. zg-YB36]MDL5352232.1 glycerophosphodiester phosphodiesterase family protein [Microbacterium sp. zg-YB36]